MDVSLPEPLRLLVVDDDQELRELLRVMLEEEGYAVSVATTPDRALELVENHFFHLILSDIFYSPTQSSLQSILPLLEATRFTPIILLTGWALTSKEATDRPEIAALITKPFDLDTLLATIAACAQKPFWKNSNAAAQQKQG
jgi:DNA-binding NtrC family response regulator